MHWKKYLATLAICMTAGCTTTEDNEINIASLECVNGMLKCDNQMVLICDNNHWTMKENCSGNMTCDSITFQCTSSSSSSTSCTENEQKCDNNRVMLCKNGVWGIKISCNFSQNCNPTTFVCDENVVQICNQGAVKCENNTPYICQNNSWIPKAACQSTQQCNAITGECDTKTCTPGQSSCIENVYTYCDSHSQYKTETCTDGCNRDGCITTENPPVQIDPNEGNCTQNGQTIVNGASLCINNLQVTCEDGETTSEQCETGSYCPQGGVMCVPYQGCENGISHGETACNINKNIVKCDNGTLSEVQNCVAYGMVCMADAGNVSCQAVKVTDCELNGTTIREGGTICDPTTNAPRLCTAGTLAPGVDCRQNHNGNSLCKDGACIPAPCGDVPNRKTKCNDAKTSVEICEDGTFNEYTACDINEVCTETAEGPKCIEQKSYNYGSIAEIHNDIFGLINTATCNDSIGTAKAEIIEANVEFTGVVTSIYSNNIVIQDPNVLDGKNAGIAVNCTPTTCEKIGFPTDGNGDPVVSIGDNVRVTANGIGHNYCQLMVRKFSINTVITKTNEQSIITPTQVTASNINTGIDNPYNGTLVKLTDITAVSYSDVAPKGWTLRDVTGDILANTRIYSGIQTAFTAGASPYIITGIVMWQYAKSGIAPRTRNDIQLIECTGTETTCSNNKQRTCENGSWGSPVQCQPYNIENTKPACTGNVCGYECKNDNYELVDGECLLKIRCGNNIVNSAEDCDGGIGANSCASVTGDPNAAGTLSCTQSCTWDKSACLYCGNGTVDSAIGEACDGGTVDCTTAKNDGKKYTGSASCTSSCQWDTSACQLAPYCDNGTLDPGEECDGSVPPGVTCATKFGSIDPNAEGSINACIGCMYDTSSCKYCGNGKVDRTNESCDGSIGNESCASIIKILYNADGATGTLTCKNDCTWDTSACKWCGDGTVGTGELCELGQTTSCSAAMADNHYTGTATCMADCKGWNTDACRYQAVCGDGKVDDGEVCDGSDLNGKTCASVSSYSNAKGNLKCKSNCTEFDTSECYRCGDFKLDPGEECDYNDFGTQTCASVTGITGAGGSLRCTYDCKLDTDMCEYCGNGALELNRGEQCDPYVPTNANCFNTINDGNNYSGDLTCNTSTCMFDTSQCHKVTPTYNSCTDANGDPVENNSQAGCYSATAIGTCIDGTMQMPVGCNSIPNGTVSCKLGECILASCDGGYEPNSYGGCDPIPPDNCTDYVSNGIVPSGSKGCSSSSSTGLCNDGSWINEETCGNGGDSNAYGYCGNGTCKTSCKDGFMYNPFNYMCDPVPVISWCELHWSTPNDGTDIRVLVPDNATVSAYLACTLDASRPIQEWTTYVAPPDTCSPDDNCGSNAKYYLSPSGMPQEPGDYTCVALATVSGGNTYVCYNRDNSSNASPVGRLSPDAQSEPYNAWSGVINTFTVY